MSRYLAITTTVEVEVGDDVTDDEADAVANTVVGVIKTAIPDAVDVSLSDYIVSDPDGTHPQAMVTYATYRPGKRKQPDRHVRPLSPGH